MEANTGTTDGKGGWSTTQKILVGGVAAIVILGGAYIGYMKFYKKPEPGKDGALPGAGESGSETTSASTEIKTSGGGSVETTAPKSQPGNTGIGGGGTTNSTKGGGSGGAGGGGKSTSTSEDGKVRTDFDGAWNYQLRNGVWFTAKKSNPGKWTSLAQNKIASDKLFTKYPKG